MAVVAALLGLTKLPHRRRAIVIDVRAPAAQSNDLAARLRELGFLDGEHVCVLEQAVAGGPLAVRVGETTFALRRREADCVFVERVAG